MMIVIMMIIVVMVPVSLMPAVAVSFHMTMFDASCKYKAA
jgi:hypothetical protein